MSCMSGSTRESGTTESTVRRLGLVAGVCVVGIWVLGAVAAPLAPYRADEQRLLEAFQPPSVRHPFGTDDLGRDVLTRVSTSRPRSSVPKGWRTEGGWNASSSRCSSARYGASGAATAPRTQIPTTQTPATNPRRRTVLSVVPDSRVDPDIQDIDRQVDADV